MPNFLRLMATHSCLYCPKFEAPSKRLLHHHIRLVHSQDPSFIIQCSYCSCTFRNIEVFKTTNWDTSQAEDRQEESDCSTDYLEFNSDEDTIVQRQPTNDHSLYSAKWILKMSETRKLTRAATISIVEDTSDFIEEILMNAKDQLLISMNEVALNVIRMLETLSREYFPVKMQAWGLFVISEHFHSN